MKRFIGLKKKPVQKEKIKTEKAEWVIDGEGPKDKKEQSQNHGLRGWPWGRG